MLIIKLVEKTLRVGIVARQSQPIFWPRWSRRDARFVRPFKVNGKQMHAVIGTDARTVRPYMHSSGSPSPPFCTSIRLMRECRDARFVRPLKVNGKQIHAVIGTDARAVRPYMHSSSSPSPPFYALIRLMWVCRDARFVRPLHVNKIANARFVRPHII